MGQLLASFGGVQVRRVIDRARACVPEHAHDWPVLSLFVLGGYRNTTELSGLDIAGPSAVLYGAGAAHANAAGADGFEQIEFDADWLSALPDRPVTRWTDGAAATAARTLARICAARPREAVLRRAVRTFAETTGAAPDAPPPAWLPPVDALLRANPGLGVAGLAAHVGRHPAWLGAAYARRRGESLPQTAARLRTERAARLLRETDDPPAAIAADAGFCDQSHMIRVFRRLLGRTPTDVRADRCAMRGRSCYT